jgi:VWFA-related protein
MRILPLLMVVLGSGVAIADEPVKGDLSEHVEVRLVTIDVIALDQADQTVPGLGKESFRLFVDRKETPIDTVDSYCGDTPEDDPKSLKFGGWATPANLANETRRTVLAFDYLHLPYVVCPELSYDPDHPRTCMLHTQALQAYQAAFAAKPEIQDEEIMVVALTGGLRVEQPFTRDRKAVIETLRRMEFDVTLWNGNFEQMTEFGFFRSLEALTTLLRVNQGPKSVVLLTAGAGPDDSYDGDFARIAAAASDARARIYPVDCRGLVGGIAPSRSASGSTSGTSRMETGGPPGFDRLASITGGRLTASSGDFTIGYARARRDSGCRYTIGFYDRKPEEDRSHAVRVESAVPGLVVHHASTYSFPSRETRRRRTMQAAYMVPKLFEGGGMRAQIFTLKPRDRRTWDALVAIDFPVPLDMQSTGPLRREFGAVLMSGPVVSSRFGRTVTLEGSATGQRAERRLTFLEPAALSPGRYTLTAVLSDPGAEAAFTAHVELTVPDIPSRRPFLVGPLIGRRSGPDVVIHGGEDRSGAPADSVGGSASFRPLIVTETDRTQPLFALTQACVSKKQAKRGPWRVARSLETAAGVAAGALDDGAFPGPDGAAMICESWLDQVPVSRLRLGAYTFSATVSAHDPGSTLDTRAARFLLVQGGANRNDGD